MNRQIEIKKALLKKKLKEAIRRDRKAVRRGE